VKTHYASDSVAVVELRPTALRVKVVNKLRGDEAISSLKIKIIFMSRTFVLRLYSFFFTETFQVLVGLHKIAGALI
jgi:hypothetical protein